MVSESAPNDSFIGKQIGNYVLMQRIGDGTFGSVYQARHSFLSRNIVAIKILKSTSLNTEQEKEAFFNEAKFLDILHHRHILPILDAGIQDNRPYMMVEYAPSGSLRDHIVSQRPGRLPMREALLVLSQIGQALQYAHRNNIVHRDLKPANILFNDKEEALLADFGIALQLEGTKHLKDVQGTFPYMAPEQFDHMVSKKSDQYALACIAYELFTGRTPLTASGKFDPKAEYVFWYNKVHTEEPLSPLEHNPDLGSHIAETILRALSKKRDERYPDISTFMREMASESPLVDIADVPTIFVSEDIIQNVYLGPQKTVEQWLAEADDHYKNNRLEEALTAYEQATQLGHKAADTAYIKGNILHKLERYEEALLAYDQAIQLGYKDPMVHYYRGYVLSRLDRYEEALTAYEQAIKLDPTKAVFHGSIGNVFRELKHYADALKAYNEAIRISPRTPIFHIHKGEVLLTLQEFEQAVDAYDQALKFATHGIKAKAYVGQATAFLRLRRNVQAIEAYENATSIDPSIISSSLCLAKGDAFWRDRQNQKALEVYQEGLALDPGNERLQQKISAMQRIIQGQSGKL